MGNTQAFFNYCRKMRQNKKFWTEEFPQEFDVCKKRQERSRHTEKWGLIFPGKSLACSFDWAGIFNEIWVIYREYVSSWSYLPKINLSRYSFFWASKSRSIWRSFFQLMENSLDTRGSNCVSNMCSFIRTHYTWAVNEFVVRCGNLACSTLAFT